MENPAYAKITQDTIMKWIKWAFIREFGGEENQWKCKVYKFSCIIPICFLIDTLFKNDLFIITLSGIKFDFENVGFLTAYNKWKIILTRQYIHRVQNQ